MSERENKFLSSRTAFRQHSVGEVGGQLLMAVVTEGIHPEVGRAHRPASVAFGERAANAAMRNDIFLGTAYYVRDDPVDELPRRCPVQPRR